MIVRKARRSLALVRCSGDSLGSFSDLNTPKSPSIIRVVRGIMDSEAVTVEYGDDKLVRL